LLSVGGGKHQKIPLNFLCQMWENGGGEVKVYAVFGTNQVGDVKIMFIILIVAAKPQFGR